jgi:rSAM/selenodomain-associated transferase 1
MSKIIPTLIQFAKFPVLGNVKTRLEPLLSKQGSYDLHIKLVGHMNEVLRKSNGSPVLFLDKIDRHPIIDSIKKHTPLDVQVGDDLGERMLNAINRALETTNRVLLVGSDCPVLSPEIIQKALDSLDSADMVFVPAEDGGYVLVGASKPNPNVFKNIPWGTGNVMEETLKVLNRDQTRYQLLDMLWDVDRPEDYERLMGCLPDLSVTG